MAKSEVTPAQAAHRRQVRAFLESNPTIVARAKARRRDRLRRLGLAYGPRDA